MVFKVFEGLATEIWENKKAKTIRQEETKEKSK